MCMKDVKENRVNNLVIGNVKLDGNLILAPMAGVTDLPFRMLCKEQGASLVYTEMISAKGIYYNNKNTGKLWETDASERPVSLQLFGSDPDLMADMAAKIEDKDFDIYDINMGCPVPKVVNNGEGSALMNNPKLAGEIIEKMTKAVKKPVTVKFRKGFGKDDNCISVSLSGGGSLVVNRNNLDDLSRAIGMFTPEDVKNMYEHTGVDGFMFGRGVRGNPWLFKRTRVYLETGEIPVPPTPEEIMDMMIRHGKMNISFKGEFTGMREMRKHAAWYTKGMKNSAQFREKCSYIETLDDLVALRELIV